MSQDDYGHGLLEGAQRQYIADRAAAFGAIRRAAEVARGLEAHKRGEIGAMHDHTHWDEAQAIAIRRAIRAAIGSPKQ